jgi:uncharacterized protein YuzE
VIVRYDTEADATYIILGEAPIGRTIELVDSFVWADVDDQGRLVGIEILQAPADIDDALLVPLQERFPTADMAGIKAALAGHNLRPAV